MPSLNLHSLRRPYGTAKEKGKKAIRGKRKENTAVQWRAGQEEGKEGRKSGGGRKEGEDAQSAKTPLSPTSAALPGNKREKGEGKSAVKKKRKEKHRPT